MDDYNKKLNSGLFNNVNIDLTSVAEYRLENLKLIVFTLLENSLVCFVASHEQTSELQIVECHNQQEKKHEFYFSITKFFVI